VSPKMGYKTGLTLPRLFDLVCLLERGAKYILEMY
jgi:hypothetical protein